ncbi:hypothetical protein, partial [Fastidiosibacter lacustris]|uniref:hypothetical protein n=1 Tax=Fastidiosibacter lacustris TaxID=2056695 RepID=UPI00195970AA
LSISTFTTYAADRTHIDWLSSGFPKQITDQVTGLKLQFNYDRYERPYSIISSDGETKRTWQYSYIDIEGYFAPVTAQAPYNDSRTVIKYSYDGRGNLGSITNELGHVVTFSQRSWQGQGSYVAQIIDENGIKTDLDYRYIVYEDISKSRGYATYHKHPQSVTINGNTTHYQYDDKDRLIYKRTPAGVTYRYEYDDRIIYRQTPEGVAYPKIKKEALISLKDSAGNVLQKEQDNQGEVIETRIKDARGNLVYQLKHSDTVASAAQGKEQDDANEYPKHK